MPREVLVGLGQHPVRRGGAHPGRCRRTCGRSPPGSPARGPGSARRASRSRSELLAPPLEKAALGVRVNQLERAVVGGPGLVDSVEPAEELGPRRVQVVVGVEVEALHQLERGFDVACLGQRGRLVEIDEPSAEGVVRRTIASLPARADPVVQARANATRMRASHFMTPSSLRNPHLWVTPQRRKRPRSSTAGWQENSCLLVVSTEVECQEGDGDAGDRRRQRSSLGTAFRGPGSHVGGDVGRSRGLGKTGLRARARPSGDRFGQPSARLRLRCRPLRDAWPRIVARAWQVLTRPRS